MTPHYERRATHASIHYDGNRANGRWYATVTVETRQGEDAKPQESQLEVILNGPGKSKAKKKIARQLEFRNIYAGDLKI